MTGTDDHRAMNRSMAERLEGAPAAEIQERGYALRVLHSTGRVSGEARATPLGALRLGGELHLVSPVADRDWVRNLRAEPRCALSAGGSSDTFTAVEISGSHAAPAVRAYLDAVEVPWALRAFPVEKSASIADIEAAMPALAVFRLAPRTGA